MSSRGQASGRRQSRQGGGSSRQEYEITAGPQHASPASGSELPPPPFPEVATRYQANLTPGTNPRRAAALTYAQLSTQPSYAQGGSVPPSYGQGESYQSTDIGGPSYSSSYGTQTPTTRPPTQRLTPYSSHSATIPTPNVSSAYLSGYLGGLTQDERDEYESYRSSKGSATDATPSYTSSFGVLKPAPVASPNPGTSTHTQHPTSGSPWTPKEDYELLKYGSSIQKNGHPSWEGVKSAMQSQRSTEELQKRWRKLKTRGYQRTWREKGAAKAGEQEDAGRGAGKKRGGSRS